MEVIHLTCGLDLFIKLPMLFLLLWFDTHGPGRLGIHVLKVEPQSGGI